MLKVESFGSISDHFNLNLDSKMNLCIKKTFRCAKKSPKKKKKGRKKTWLEKDSNHNKTILKLTSLCMGFNKNKIWLKK